MTSVLIAAGGTGGHIFPGLALADALGRLAPGVDVSFVGTPRGLETTIIPDRGYRLHLLAMRPFTRSFGLRPLLAVLSLVRATRQASKLLRAESASVVVGMGGYASLPAVIASWMRRTPSLVHESGAIPGLANRVAARFTRNVALSFPEAAGRFRRSVRPRVVGMPLAREIARLDRSALRERARASYDLPDDATAVLVLGGSLGAMRLNEIGVGLAARWRDRDDVRIVLKAGRDKVDEVEAEIERRGAGRIVRCVAFLERMDEAYAAADVALCRAGAGTVAELAAAGLPAVLVPYPHAPGDHQTKNAMPLVRAGAALLVPDAQADPARIASMLEGLLDPGDVLERMGERARTLARPDAADELARWVLDVAEDAGG